MLDLDALARLETRLSGSAAAPRPEETAPPRPAALPEEESAARRCPHLAAMAAKELEGAQ